MSFLEEKIRQLKADLRDAQTAWETAQDQFDSTLNQSEKPQIQR